MDGTQPLSRVPMLETQKLKDEVKLLKCLVAQEHLLKNPGACQDLNAADCKGKTCAPYCTQNVRATKVIELDKV